MQVTESIRNEYHQKLYRFIQYRVSDTSDADDDHQEASMRVHPRIDTLKDSKMQNIRVDEILMTGRESYRILEALHFFSIPWRAFF
jgi:hypothetical protein